ncbi:MAG: class I SAM-dependent methyltransferase [Deltaproteobacteria bacterium]|nr:class I SAM-dependent methyltransferase [Deltaproteobacteria bacterium]MBW1816964.1 class I SAM-dependent methyltransferase [Deltaproteobacteria bacterium]MBW2283586.1 class I SAM-dependent methyltransferase [Deltaproteobacteria bacterium]
MVAIAASNNRDDPASRLIEYKSNALQMFFERMAGEPESRVLDLGPACEENIRLFAGRLGRVTICDMFIRLDRCIRRENPLRDAWTDLDYPPETFDGIVLWDLADRLDDREVSMLVVRCRDLLKPGGTAVLFALGEESETTIVNSFVVEPDFRVHQRTQHHLSLPIRGRQSRDVLGMMHAFTPLRSFICRPGLVEFLFRRT